MRCLLLLAAAVRLLPRSEAQGWPTAQRHVYCYGGGVTAELQVLPGVRRPTWAKAAEEFLARRDLSQGTRRVYGLTLDRLGQHLPGLPMDVMTGAQIEAALASAYPASSAAAWNRHVATVRSLVTFCARRSWCDPSLASMLERRRVVEDHNRALPAVELDRLWVRRDLSLRDRTLFRLLYDTAARAQEVLRLDVQDLDLAQRRAVTVRKGGAVDTLHFATGSARLLPRLVAGRTSGPVFLSSVPPSVRRTPAVLDLDPATGHGRLSYRRAAQIFSDATAGRTLHQLRHSAITELAEAGVPLPLLMAKSRHTSLRTLQRYAQPGQDAVAALTAAHDPHARRYS